MGFYSTGPKIKENDLQIDALFRRFHPSPVFVIIDVRPGVEGIPVAAYRSKEEVEMVRAVCLCVWCVNVRWLLWGVHERGCVRVYGDRLKRTSDPTYLHIRPHGPTAVV